MTDPPYDEEFLRLVHQVKRTRWQQKGGGEEYQYYAYKTDPVTRLKNVSEIAFVLRNAVGPRVLDAGAGTGRFTMPLRKKGFEACGLDISPEMLNQGRKIAGQTGAAFPCLIGDIERLPYADNTFDTVVSITVLRHFPKWRAILAEYVRVLRPGGRVIFDMGSGDQRAYLVEHGMAPAAAATAQDPITFDAALSMSELNALSRELGLKVCMTTPYDFFHVNDLLVQALGEAYPDIERQLHEALAHPGAVMLYEQAFRSFFPALSPALTSSWLMVLEKQGGNVALYVPPYRTAKESAPAVSGEAALLTILQECLGEQFGERVREVATLLSEPEASRFFQVCRNELLPRFPLDALYWDRDE